MITALISRLVIVVCGTLYPAYASYKAVKSRDLKEYVRWMMYWIVFALFTSAEVFTDVFLSFWFPFYYELKILLVLWLLPPLTRGSSILYRSVVHPLFTKREQEIDQYIAKAKDQGYNVMIELGTKGVSLATNAIMSTAIKGGNGLFYHIRKSYSLNDLYNNIEDKNDGVGIGKPSRDVTKRHTVTDGVLRTSCDNSVDTVLTKQMVSAGSQADLTDIGDETLMTLHRRHVHEPRMDYIEDYVNVNQKDSISRRLRSSVKNSSHQDEREDEKDIQMSKKYFQYPSFFPYHLLHPSFYHPYISRDSLFSQQHLIRDFNFVRDESGSPQMNNTTIPFPPMMPLPVDSRYLTLPQLHRSSSSPDVRVLDEPKPIQVTGTPPVHKKKHKRIAPQPPVTKNEFLTVPKIYVTGLEQEKPSSADCLQHKNLSYKVRKQKSRLRKILSKSKEILTVWHKDEVYSSEDDMYSAKSETGSIGASSDESVASSSPSHY